MTTSFRRRVELKAGPLVVLLARLPRIVPFAVVLGLLVAGLLVEGTGGAALLAILALLLAVLLFLAWPALQQQARFLRVLIVVLVLARAVTFVL